MIIDVPGVRVRFAPATSSGNTLFPLSVIDEAPSVSARVLVLLDMRVSAATVLPLVLSVPCVSVIVPVTVSASPRVTETPFPFTVRLLSVFPLVVMVCVEVLIMLSVPV